MCGNILTVSTVCLPYKKNVEEEDKEEVTAKKEISSAEYKQWCIIWDNAHKKCPELAGEFSV